MTGKAAAGPPVATPGATPAGRTGRRRAHSLMLGSALLGMAVALGSLLLVWVSQTYGADASRTVAQKGSAAAPAVLPLTLVALAGLAASYAGRGLLRRAIGLAIAGAGVGLAVAGGAPLWNPPTTAVAADVTPPAPAELMGPVVVHPFGPALAILGGLLIAAAGTAVLIGVGTRRLGSRFDLPAGSSAAQPVSSDVKDADAAAAWWRALDAGADPTVPADERGGGVVGSDGPGQLP